MAAPTKTQHLQTQNIDHRDEEEADVHDTHHVVPLSVYFMVFAALMVLLVITLGAAAIDFEKVRPGLGWINILVAITIAVVKAVLIILFFMHVRYSSRLTHVFCVAAFVWLAILFVLTSVDFVSREWLPSPADWTEKPGG